MLRLPLVEDMAHVLALADGVQAGVEGLQGALEVCVCVCVCACMCVRVCACVVAHGG
jgi:hypothetical protein